MDDNSKKQGGYETLFRLLKDHVQSADFGDGYPIIALLYEVYNGYSRMDDDQIKSDFDELYHKMNGMSLKDMDNIIYPVCTLCRDHAKAGFAAGVKVGIRLREELSE